MPLRVVSEAQQLHSFDFNEDQWRELKATYRSRGLRIPCCGARAIPKTSVLGTQFFAHARKGDCSTAPESQEHLFCKAIVALAAQSAGWKVTTERAGTSPAGHAWVADVFCEKGKAKVAIEIQMSRQAPEELKTRQQRYKESGVRAAWLVGARAHSEEICFNYDTPAFGLPTFEAGQIPRVERFGIPLDEFVLALMTRRLRWHVPQVSVPLIVDVIPDTCWACKKPVKQVYGHYAAETEDFEDFRLERHYTPASLSKELEELAEKVGNDELRSAGLNIVGTQQVIHGKKTAYPYCNLCIHCRAPQNNFYVGEKIQAREHALYCPTGDDSNALPTEAQSSADDFYVAFPRTQSGAGEWVLVAGDETDPKSR